MNWYNCKILQNHITKSVVFHFGGNKKKMIKTASYGSKDHSVDFSSTGFRDGYTAKIQLTNSKTGARISVVVVSNIYSFPLIEENWEYPEKENKRCVKTFNRCVNIFEDLKADFEEDDTPGPTLQGFVREAFRYVDVDRKLKTNNRSLEGAKYSEGVSDWRESLYGGHYPPKPTININNSGTVNINNGT